MSTENDVAAFEAMANLATKVGVEGPGKITIHKGPDELRATVRVAAVVDRVDAHEQVTRIERLGPRERDRQQDRVARRNVRRRDPVRDGVVGSRLRDLDRSIGERRPPGERQIDPHDPMLDRPERARDRGGTVEFDPVALAVVDGQRSAAEPALARDRDRRRRIEPAGRVDLEDDRFGVLRGRGLDPVDEEFGGDGRNRALVFEEMDFLGDRRHGGHEDEDQYDRQSKHR